MKYFVQETCIICAIKLSRGFGAAVRQLLKLCCPSDMLCQRLYIYVFCQQWPACPKYILSYLTSTIKSFSARSLTCYEKNVIQVCLLWPNWTALLHTHGRKEVPIWWIQKNADLSVALLFVNTISRSSFFLQKPELLSRVGPETQSEEVWRMSTHLPIRGLVFWIMTNHPHSLIDMNLRKFLWATLISSLLRMI